MTLITALEIQTNGDNVKCLAGGPDKTGKWTGWIYLYRDGDIHKAMLSTEAVFETEAEALTHMEDLVTEVRELDLAQIMQGR